MLNELKQATEKVGRHINQQKTKKMTNLALGGTISNKGITKKNWFWMGR